ncbi:hypothetical protein Acr_29g0007940 [Actinidia rufa]|uniref:Uncharacterized protein n=1 Tax=Actinidia rufa TaxID=165716 RepID=A0A7J0HF05_9ERIC|nr:hypothetical protein Acr_29g0007940 [Actinidia rufa]
MCSGVSNLNFVILVPHWLLVQPLSLSVSCLACYLAMNSFTRICSHLWPPHPSLIHHFKLISLNAVQPTLIVVVAEAVDDTTTVYSGSFDNHTGYYPFDNQTGSFDNRSSALDSRS